MHTPRQELLNYFQERERLKNNQTLREELIYRGDDYLPPVDQHVGNPFGRPHEVRERYHADDYGDLPTVDSTAPPATRDEFFFGMTVGAVTVAFLALIVHELFG